VLLLLQFAVRAFEVDRREELAAFLAAAASH
jgi:hypothetical protein